MHFSIVTTSFTQDINHFSQRILGIVGPFHDTDNGLITILSSFQFVFRDKDIIRQGLVLGNQEGKTLCHLKFTHKYTFLGFEYLNHFTFGFSSFTTGKQLNFHAVAIHCMSRVPFSNEYRCPFSIRNKRILPVASPGKNTFGNRTDVVQAIPPTIYFLQVTTQSQIFQYRRNL